MKKLLFIILLLGILAIEAIITRWNILFHLFYLVSAGLLFSFFWAWTGVRGVKLMRKTRATRAQVGKVFEEQFLVHNRGWFPKLWIEMRDFSDLPWHHASRVVTALSPRHRRNWTVRTVCRRRGKFTLGPVTITSGDPLGLFRFQKYNTSTTNLIVYPPTVELPAFAPSLGVLPGGAMMRRRTHYITTNVAGVREYAPGDSFNRIHWPSTARTGRLIVKEFELDPTADVWVFLDAEDRIQAGTVAHLPPPVNELDTVPALLMQKERAAFTLEPLTEEYGVAIAASVAKHFLTRDRTVGFVSYGQRREVIPADRGPRQLNKILETLAMFRTRGRIPFEQVLTAESKRFSRDTTIVAITASAEEGWISAMQLLKRKGLRVIAVFIEPQSFGGAASHGARAALQISNIPTYVVKNGDDLAVALSVPESIALETPHFA